MRLLNVLIVVTLLAGIAAVGSVILTVAEIAPSISIGSVTAETGGSVTQVQVPITVSNKGTLSLSDILVRADIVDSSDDELLVGLAGPLTVPPGATSQLTLTAFLDTDSLPTAVLQRFATTNENVTVKAFITSSMPPFLKISGNVSTQLAWDAPVSGLTVGTPVFSSMNSTGIGISVPVSFENLNRYVAIAGTGTIDIFNATGARVASRTVEVNTPPGTRFQQNVSLSLSTHASQLNSLLFDNQTLSYTAVVSLQSSGQSLLNITEPIVYGWKAPLSSLAVEGSLSAHPYNSTYSTFSAALSFTDGSPFFDVRGNVTGSLTDPSGATVGSISPFSVSATSGQLFSAQMTCYIKTSSASETPLTLNLVIQTKLGTVTEEVAMNG